jgi:release factor glutamine methyltransferase
LEAVGIDDPEPEAIWLLAHVLSSSPTRLRLRFDEEISQAPFAKLKELLDRRRRRIPLQHLLGTAPFLDFELEVTPDVLIPRPETEVLALAAIKALKSRKDPQHLFRALDIGTGSGCLAISIAVAFPKAEVVAGDKSEAALRIARRNAQACGASGIRFVPMDLLAARDSDFSDLDLIVSNPPYIPSGDIAGLQIEVRDHDPRLALDGGFDGLDFYRKLSEVGLAWLRPGAWMLMEFGDGQALALVDLFSGAGWNDISVEKDLSGRDRVLIVRRPQARQSRT